MHRNHSLYVAPRAALIALLGLFLFIATGSAKAGIWVPNPEVVGAEAAAAVHFDMVELLPEEQDLLEDLAGGGSFEVLAGWEVGSQPGQKASEIVIEDVDVTSEDGSTFTLYTVDDQGVQSSLDVVVEEDGVLAVYDPASDSVAYFSPVGAQLVSGSQATPESISDSAKKKKKKKKKKKGPKKPKPDPDSECFQDSDCAAGEVCILNPRGEGMCYEPIFKKGF